eukprot:scaffold154489_cov20-Prasinocladus_malaysianus.AAC.1
MQSYMLCTKVSAICYAPMYLQSCMWQAHDPSVHGCIGYLSADRSRDTGQHRSYQMKSISLVSSKH